MEAALPERTVRATLLLVFQHRERLGLRAGVRWGIDIRQAHGSLLRLDYAFNANLFAALHVHPVHHRRKLNRDGMGGKLVVHLDLIFGRFVVLRLYLQRSPLRHTLPNMSGDWSGSCWQQLQRLWELRAVFLLGDDLLSLRRGRQLLQGSCRPERSRDGVWHHVLRRQCPALVPLRVRLWL